MQNFPLPGVRKNGDGPEGKFRVCLIDSSRAFLRAASIFFLARPEVASVDTIASSEVTIQKVTMGDPNMLVLEYLPEDGGWMQTISDLRQVLPKVYILVLENEVIPSFQETLLEEFLTVGANEVYSKSVLSQQFTLTLERAKNWTASIQGK